MSNLLLLAGGLGAVASSSWLGFPVRLEYASAGSVIEVRAFGGPAKQIALRDVISVAETGVSYLQLMQATSGPLALLFANRTVNLTASRSLAIVLNDGEVWRLGTRNPGALLHSLRDAFAVEGLRPQLATEL